MSIIAFLKKEDESACQCEIRKLSHYIVLDEVGNAQLGLEAIFENNSKQMRMTGVRIVLGDKLGEMEQIVECSTTLLDVYNPWNLRYSGGYKCINQNTGELIVDGIRCDAIGLEVKVNKSYKDINILDVNFQKTDQGCQDAILPGGRGVFRMIISLKEYARNRGDSWVGRIFLNLPIGIPPEFQKNIEKDTTQIIEINKNPCDIHVIIPPHMCLRSTVPVPVSETAHVQDLFSASKLEHVQEGAMWRARHIMEGSDTTLKCFDTDGHYSWIGVNCNFRYGMPITREWLTETIRTETKNALDEYMNEMFSKLFK